MLRIEKELGQRCSRRSRDADFDKFGLARQASVHYNHGRTIWADINAQHYRHREQTLTADQIDARTSHLAQIRTSCLPALRQHLADLLVSLDVTDSQKAPCPNLPKTLDITFHISKTLTHFQYSLNSVVLAAPVPSDKDHDLDILKNHRTEALAQNVYSLIQHGLKPLFNHHADFLLGFEDSKEHQSATPNHSTILQSTTEAFEMIDNLMRWFQKSDFCFIQEHWQASIDCAKAHMLSVIPSLNSLVRDAQESDPANNNESDPQPSATSALQQNQPFQNNSPTTFEPNPPPEASPAQEHQSEEIKFIQASIALIKLVRIFFDKLLITPTTKPPFTFHTRVTSTEINTMGNAIDSLPCDMQSLIINLDGYWFNDGRPRCYQAKRESISVLFRFDSIIEMLRLHLVPLHPQLDLPASEPESENTFFDSCFSLIFPPRLVLYRSLDSWMSQVPSTSADPSLLLYAPQIKSTLLNIADTTFRVSLGPNIRLIRQLDPGNPR
ncbi:hypothetical protein PTTG_11774 [Puccinia triticina 1-1 BBBD Race 1]|uniref:Uncharacterized protein n=1 Tax=Puccinia triticina (isolate 1-1 / race 1 (BBBD)) TaxID=630390 RepID=A0A180GVX9_PUCT1|nr:hypothetical protein PTTG_11774 [Puccinia triticina 1-1 BBBD Race 1]